jgi:arginine utilization protein RocB
MLQCQELAPAIVLLFVPPYYPAVNSSDDELVGPFGKEAHAHKRTERLHIKSAFEMVPTLIEARIRMIMNK